jgi:LPXTG-motif cell wall-anchored protein
MSIDKNLWEYDGEAWVKSGNEDRFGILWNTDDSIADFNTRGCTVLCHAKMYTNAEGEFGDMWHWKAARSNPMGFVDDKYLNNTADDEDGGRHGDGGDSTYQDNVNEAGDGPTYTWAGTPSNPPAVPANLAGRFLLDADAVAIIDPAAGDRIPGYVLRNPSGSRADVRAHGTWADGVWTVEVERALDVGANAVKDGEKVDQILAPGGTYHFGLAIMDDTGSNHSVAASSIALALESRAVTVLPATGGEALPPALMGVVAAGLIALISGLLLWRRRD